MYFQRKVRKDGTTGVFIYQYNSSTGKSKTLPRALTKHLDNKADWEIEDWMRWYAAVHQIEHRTPLKIDLGGIEPLLERFLKFLKSQNKAKSTIGIYHDRLRDILPFFANHTNFHEWYLLCGPLYDHMLAKGWDANRHNRCNIAFRAFYRWLQEQGVIQHRHALMLRNRPMLGRNTPLQYTLTPEAVLDFVNTTTVPELKLMALLGFFFSLRTDEVFGLRKTDFIAGSAASNYEAAKVMAKAKLYSKLVANIRRCRKPSGVEYTPSSRKRGGVVACFDERAAKAIVALIKEKTAEEYLVASYTPDYWGKRWRKEGIKNITPKDLRRASLYYLGHYTELNFVDLKNHARHSQPSTTALYIRRPEEAFDNAGLDELDLEA